MQADSLEQALADLHRLEATQPNKALLAYLELWQTVSEADQATVTALALIEKIADLSFRLNQLEQAQAYWGLLCQLQPSARNLNNLAGVTLKSGQISVAIRHFEQALHVQPDLWSAQLQLGMILIKSKPEQAIDYFEALVEKHLSKLAPCAKGLYNTGLSLIQQKEMALAERYLALCCRMPESIPVSLHSLLASRAHCAQSQGQVQTARDYLGQAAVHAPQPLIYAWSQLNSLPYIYASQDEISAYREDYQQGLLRLSEQLEYGLDAESSRLLLSTLRAPFLLAYQGYNDRNLMTQIGQLWSDFLSRQAKLKHCTHQVGQQRKIQVGFISSHFYGHSVSLCFAELIKQLAREPDIDVTCIHLRPHSDSHTQALKEQVHQFIQVSGPVSLQDLLNLKLDVLIYTDIGMDYRAYQLALHRLAPIQCVLPGHPVTTGLPRIDYYLSSPLCEPADAQNHYSESLILLANDLARYPPVERPSRRWSRSELGLPADKHLYFCPMTLFKIHPDFDRALQSILQQDPLAVIYFCRYQGTALHQILQKRFLQQMPVLAQRIQFLPWLDPERFYSLILLADVVLDSFHFGGGSTSRMVLGLGQPMVTLPGPFFRGRISYGCYQRMGLEHDCPATVEDYVSQALKLAKEADYRQFQQKRIQQQIPRLVEQTHHSSQLAEFLRATLAGSAKRV